MHTCVYHKQAIFDETLGQPTEKGSSSSTTSMPRSPVRSSCTRQVSPVKYMTLSRPYSELEFFQVCYDQKFPWDGKTIQNINFMHSQKRWMLKNHITECTVFLPHPRFPSGPLTSTMAPGRSAPGLPPFRTCTAAPGVSQDGT